MLFRSRGVDLGCGTGLMGVALGAGKTRAVGQTPVVRSLAGVDLSPKMVDFARMTGAYDRLVAGDLIDFLAAENDAACDLVVAADVFVYIGDLGAIFTQCARTLVPNGILAFSVQHSEDADWKLGGDLRYAHSQVYLRGLAARHGFEAALLEEASTRKDAGRDVPGLVCVLART